jgi:acyl-CoA synthetase (NDP forming)
LSVTSEPSEQRRPDAVDLRRFYEPASVAVVGAHDTRSGLSQFTRQAMSVTRTTGGAFYPVNPKLDTVYGVPCVPSVAHLPDVVDVLCIFTGNALGILQEAAAAQRRAHFVMVFANGFSELQTAEGVAKERELVAAAHAIGARLIGPNTNLNAWDERVELSGQMIAVVAQSGNQGRPIVEAQEVGVGISYWAPTGNEADLEAADFIEFFASDPSTAAICCYVEGFTSGQRLREAAATAIEQKTPLAVVKVGRTAAGAAMAQSHTGHLAGSDEVFDAFFEQFGITRVDELTELTEVGIALARCPLPDADGIGIMSASGGTAAHVADLVGALGLHMPKLSEDTQAALRRLIPAEFRVDNPVDNGGPSMFTGAGPQMWQAMLEDPSIGLLLSPIPASSAKLTEAVVAAVLEAAATATKPILPIWLSPYVRDENYDALWAAGLPVFHTIGSALIAARALLNHPGRSAILQATAKLARSLPPITATASGETLSEADATRWLTDRGFTFAPHAEVTSADGAAAAADELGYPVVVKATGVAHKSELGLVATGLPTADAVRSAAATMLERGAVGLLVARHESGGVELLVGLSTDPVLGPVIVVGSGGVAAEAIRDVQRSVLPLTRERVETMLSRLHIMPLLDGWRGAPAADKEDLIETILRVAALAETGAVLELDINPLLARPEGVVGLDALVRLAAGAPTSGRG